MDDPKPITSSEELEACPAHRESYDAPTVTVIGLVEKITLGSGGERGDGQGTHTKRDPS